MMLETLYLAGGRGRRARCLVITLTELRNRLGDDIAQRLIDDAFDCDAVDDEDDNVNNDVT